MLTSTTATIFMLIAAYLCGSISSAVIVCRMSGLPDPRKHGSKNPGASNVLRLSGKKNALIVMGVDLFKGLLPVLVAKLLPISELSLVFIGLVAVIGHMFPIFFSFHGGKGVATALGALLGLQFILGFLVALTWLFVARTTRYASFASLTAMLLMPLYSLYTIGGIGFTFPLYIMTILIFYKHRENINRLIDGSEPKIAFTTDSGTAPIANNSRTTAPPKIINDSTATAAAKPAEKPAVSKGNVAKNASPKTEESPKKPVKKTSTKPAATKAKPKKQTKSTATSAASKNEKEPKKDV